ncbi:MAG: ComEC/Rec2 family competence protein [Prevotella sp.]
MAKQNPRGPLQAMPVVRYAILFMAGILAADNVAMASNMAVALTVLALTAGVAIIAWRRYQLAASGAVMAGIMATGAIRYDAMLDSMVSEKTSARMEMVVGSEPREYGKTLQYDAIITQGGRMKGHHVHVAELRDSAVTTATRGLGTRLRGYGEVSPLSDTPHSSHNNFSYRRWLMARGITETVFILKAAEVVREEQREDRASDIGGIGIADRLRLKALTVRQSIIQRMEEPRLDNKTLSIAAAMALGYKTRIDKETRDAYSMAGASHILALSGMHLAIIYMVLTTVFGRRGGWRRWLIITLIWAYVLMVGMPVSVVRAATMLSLHHIADMSGRRQHQLNIIAAALLIILLASPAALWDVGLQLSFLAVTGIILIAPPIINTMPETLTRTQHGLMRGRQAEMTVRQAIARKTRMALRHIGRWLWEIMAVSVAAQIATAPMVAFYFGNIVTGFLLTNIIVIPAATAIILLTVTLIILMPVTPLAAVADMVAWTLSQCAVTMDRAVAEIASWPWACITGVRCNAVQVTMAYVVIAVGIAFIYRHRSLTELRQ